jgi:3-oxoacyl-[acyl-carrier-protein] synthase III
MDGNSRNRMGISAIATYEPPWLLANDWFDGVIPRKFVHHTGIEARPVSQEDEVTMAVRAVKNLQREVGCDLSACAAVVFASPSFIPPAAAHRLGGEQVARQERLRVAGRQLVRRLGIASCPVAAINWFCSGYSRAVALATRRFAPRLKLQPHQYLLVVTSSRISRITDYSCPQTSALFGDMATVTMLAPLSNQRHPVHFELLYADARKQPADGVFFEFHLRQNVPAPTEEGGREIAAERLVFSLDGMSIADAAPRAMAGALADALTATGLRAEDVKFVVPHQAGSGIVRLTAMKLDQLGVRAEVINGLTQRVGNISSGSIPYGLKQTWNKLTGTIACPAAAVGSPGVKEVSQGCLLFRATPYHDQIALAVA